MMCEEHRLESCHDDMSAALKLIVFRAREEIPAFIFTLWSDA